MTGRLSERLRPSTDDLIDVGFAIALSVLAVVGFRASFGDGEEITVGVPAVVAGVAVGYLLVKFRLPMLVGAAVAVVAFFALGGALALRSEAIAGVLPGPDVLSGLVDGVINGWVRLLTSVPPAPPVGNLLAIPYLAGFAGGLLTVAAALTWPRLPVCVLPPAFVLSVTVLFGVEDPVSLLLQGATFGVVVVAWLGLRVRRTEPALVAGGRRRAISGVVMLTAVGAGALVVGPNLPGAAANDRYILREQIEPPFDPSQYPSPLSRFRKYHGEEPIEGTLFTVEGLPDGEVVRFAVMDDFDGYVWRASPPGTGIGGVYQRVGNQLTGVEEGDEATVRFEMGALAAVDAPWIPTVGSPESIRFEGERSQALTEAYRFNRFTETAASPTPLEPGDTWIVDAHFPEAVDPEELATMPAQAGVNVDPPLGITDSIVGRLAEWTGERSDPYGQVLALEEKLKDIGAYNDGDQNPVPAGHGLARLVPFLEAAQPQGNGEQYAAAVAYAARSLGIPTRVVLEFDPPDIDGPVEVTAEHARAMVEIALAGEGWVAVGDPTPPESDVPKPQVSAKQPTPKNEVQPPPPTTVPPPNSLREEQLRDREVDVDQDVEMAVAAGIPAWVRYVGYAAIPLFIAASPLLLVVVLKTRRRNRRRSSGAPSRRIAAGWSELVDAARDVGRPAPATATRREWARLLGIESALSVAGTTDQWIFGNSEATDADADEIWRAVDGARHDLLAPLSRWERFRGAVSLTSLRGARP